MHACLISSSCGSRHEVEFESIKALYNVGSKGPGLLPYLDSNICLASNCIRSFAWSRD